MTIKRRITQFLSFSACSAAALFGGAWALSTQTPDLLQTRVGFTQMPLETEHRERALDLHIWYPASASADADLIAQNALMYGFQAQRDAEPQTGAHPLIVFSHGSGGRMSQIAWMASALAQEGYIVAGVNHHGTTSRDSDPHQTVQTWMRPQDISAVLDAFETGATGITADMERVASSGFSFGGYTALAMAGAQLSKAQFIDYCDAFSGILDCGWYQNAGVDITSIDATRYEADFSDARISATIAIDPALPRAMTKSSLSAMELPTLIVNFGRADEIPAGVRADGIAATMQNARYVDTANAWHFSGINACSWLGWGIIGASGFFTGEDNICADAGRSRGDVQREVLEPILAFAKEHI